MRYLGVPDWAIWLLGLVAITFIGDRVLGSALGALVGQSELRFSRMYRGGLEADILVIGNSRGVNSFYAPLLEARTGSRVFNLSYNGMSPVLGEVVLRDYLARNAVPRLVVFEVTNVYSGDQAIKELRLFRDRSAGIRELDRRRNPMLAMASRVSHLLAFNNELTLRAFYYLDRSDQAWINRRRISAELMSSVDTMSTIELPLVEENIAALKRSIELARSQGAQVTLLITPYLPEYRRKIANFENWVQNLEGRLGAPVRDFSAALADVVGFADRIHLNQRGSELFLNLLVESGLPAWSVAEQSPLGGTKAAPGVGRSSSFTPVEPRDPL